DVQAGKVIDELDRQGIRDNTIVIYIFGDNGSSAEGQRGSISELLAQNNIPNTVEQQLEALNRLGGLDALGGPKVDNMYHAGWAWAGDTPFRSTKLVAAHFGGTRNPLVVSWPKGIKPDNTMRSQFHHVVDIAPTVYEILGIPHPKVVNGYVQLPMDGVSLAYTFSDGTAEGRKETQFFDNNGSRGVYHNGWFASAFGPFTPWNAAKGGFDKSWDSATDAWQLYDLRGDFSQAIDLSKENLEKLEEMKKLFLEVAEDNKDFPIGVGNWLRLHPEDIHKTSYTSWTFRQDTRRMPEFTAPGLGKQSNKVVLDVEVGDAASGVLYALGGASGGLTLYMDKGHLAYEYNMMIIERYSAKSAKPLAAGKHIIEVTTDIKNPGAPGTVTLVVDGQEVARADVKLTVPLAFTATETFDVGMDLGSPVSPNYYDRRPFAFTGKIDRVNVELIK
ncbi:MAG: sulfatase-like hydrolase/transferase, partial [Desulfobacterales bacterium]